jgi:hypothetical protein
MSSLFAFQAIHHTTDKCDRSHGFVKGKNLGTISTVQLIEHRNSRLGVVLEKL